MTDNRQAVKVGPYDVVCFSHLRWNFVYQRPQHLLSRCAADRRVFFVEEPEYQPGVTAHLAVSNPCRGVYVLVPQLPDGVEEEIAHHLQKRLLEEFFIQNEVSLFVSWYYTPMALPFSRTLRPLAVVYDCMDELTAFKGAPPELMEREKELFQRAHLVFTGGHSLYASKRQHHPNVHAFPSSVDLAHYAQARQRLADPADQVDIPGPRLGFFGVIDERMDLALLEAAADLRPDWHYVMVGPVVKIDETDLPRRSNIHYLGGKQYAELPHYLAGWDVAIMPFARNESTKFISPTKTLEYLAAGKPVVSTSIRDVVTPYGEMGIVKIADESEAFVAAIDETLMELRAADGWIRRVDTLLEKTSWDKTWQGMLTEMERAIHHGRQHPTVVTQVTPLHPAQEQSRSSSGRG